MVDSRISAVRTFHEAQTARLTDSTADVERFVGEELRKDIPTGRLNYVKNSKLTNC